ncbi:MAG: antitoxin [Spirochaetaceae bacterium]|jgi:predicted DNA binding CopG/RHH family protein|nr:antitoxin [Spirochaetaceae bacterium]
MKDEFAPLDEYEKELMESIENDEYEVVPLSEKEKQAFVQAAINTGKKDQRMNIRMSSTDINKLKAKALHEGMPYQTLVSSILHKYVNNQLHETSSYNYKS